MDRTATAFALLVMACGAAGSPGRAHAADEAAGSGAGTTARESRHRDRGERHHGREGRGRTFDSFAKRFDSDGDGRVTRDEFTQGGQAGKSGKLARLDRDGDGAVSGDELGTESGKQRHGAAWLEKLDTDHDGRVSAEEMAAVRAARFEKLDANRDGSVDRAEFEARRKARGKADPI